MVRQRESQGRRLGRTVRRWRPFRRRHHDRAPSILIIVQNLPVPLDRRVWQECKSLVSAGYSVSVICPKGPGDPSHELLEGVSIHKYAPPPTTATVLDFIIEYAYCWLRTALLALRIARRRGVDAMQACNPPDTYFALAAPFKLFGTRFVYDQHDLVPEMYLSRFGKDTGFFPAGLRAFERATYRLADHVIATNESYAEVARSRGGMAADAITVVRSGPDPERMQPVEPVAKLRGGRDHLAVWLGIMGPQDGVDLALRAAHHYVKDLGRDDCSFAILGFGDAEKDLRALTTRLGLDDWVTFTGRADPEMIAEYLSTADVGLVPDPFTPYADLSTHNKTLEYMAHELPVVAFDLKETRASAGDAGRYVRNDSVEALAEAIAELLDDPDRRAEMGTEGRKRLEHELAWSHQSPRYVGVYDNLLRR